MNRNFWIIVGGLVLGLLLALWGGWHFAVRPLMLQYDVEAAQKQDLAQKLQTARDTAAQFGKFKAQAENMRRDLDFYTSRTDGTLSKLELTQLFNELGNQMNLGAFTVRVEDLPSTGDTADINKYDVFVDFQSDYDHVGRFVNACVSQRRIMVPDSISLNSVDDPNGFYYDTVHVEVSFAVYGGLKAKPGGRP